MAINFPNSPAINEVHQVSDGPSWVWNGTTWDLIQQTSDNGADILVYTPAGTGAVATTVKARLDQAVSLKDFGAVGDGVTDDTAAVALAKAASDNYYVPPGTYKTTGTYSSTGAFHTGPGTLTSVDSAVEYKRANTVLNITEPPAVWADGSGIINDFAGEFKSPMNTQMNVTGALTVGDPVLGAGVYVQHEQAAGRYTAAYFSSGKNTSPYSNVDRTGWAMDDQRLYHYGKGDATVHYASCFVANSDPGVLMCQGNAAAVLYNGQVIAGADKVVLNPLEINLQDGGFDVVGKGIIINLNRNNNDEDESQFWVGTRMQSTGSVAAGAAYQAVGAFDVGLDMTGMTGNNTIVLKESQAILFDGVSGYHLGAIQWTTSEAVTTGDYRYNLQNIYIATSTGTTGATAPTGTGTGFNDGGVTWDWKVANAYKSHAKTFAGTKMLWGGSNLEFHVAGSLQFTIGLNTNVSYNDLVMATGETLYPQTNAGCNLGGASNHFSTFYADNYVQAAYATAADGDAAAAGYVTVRLSGVNYKLMYKA